MGNVTEPTPHIFPMGATVRDVVTGIEGTVTGRSQWLTGCNTVGIDRGVDDKGDKRDMDWIDETRCERVGDEVLELPVMGNGARPGGPQPTPRRSNG